MTGAQPDYIQELKKRLRQNAAYDHAVPGEEDQEPEWDPDLIPDVEVRQRNPELDDFLDKIDILDAYRRWCGKMEPEVGGRSESIMVSCPDPAHPDTNPSAWINTEKQVYFCGGCNQGGDKYTIAAFHFGVPDYQSKANFPDLKIKMASDFGFDVVTSGGVSYIQEAPPEPEPDPTLPDLHPEEHQAGAEPIVPQLAPLAPEPPPAPKADPAALAPVVALRDTTDDGLPKEEIEVIDSYIDWEAILPPDTFLHDWMTAVATDDIPHEFYFFLGLQALAAAIGRNVVLEDDPFVFANLFICLYGGTGTGKSKSIVPQRRLLQEVLPFDKPVDNAATGVYLPGTPNSSEMLLDFFVHKLENGAGTALDEWSPINGIVQFGEFSELARRDARSGSTYKETLMRLYDAYEDVSSQTKGGGLTLAKQPFAQVITTTQPRVIREFLSKTDEYSGFLNRWVIVGGAPRMTPISYGGVAKDLSAPVDSLRRVLAWSLPGHSYNFHTAGRSVYKAWDGHFQRKLVPIRDMGEPMLSRFDLLQKKLVLLLAANQRRSQPTAEDVENVATLHDYLMAVARTFSQNIRETDTDRCWEEIKATIQRLTGSGKMPNGPTRRELNQRLAKKHGGEEITRALEGMVKAAVLEEVKTTNRGKTALRYKLA